MNILKHTQIELKNYYNSVLNKDQNLVKTSNDEPTPIECVEEMVSKIPNEFFENATLKILDPCCGCGNFFLIILQKLQQFHEMKHILENMLCFNDLNEDRLNVVRKVFCIDKFDLNISNKNFLEFDEDFHYDLIVANPPYARLMENGKRASKNHNLIGAFLEKTFKILKPKGLALYITPDNWMSLNKNKLIKDITSKQILHLDIHTSKKYFPKIGSSFTYYLIENVDFHKDIKIRGIYKKIEYESNVKSEIRDFIPLFYNKEVQSILAKTLDLNNKKFDILTSSDLHKTTKKELISKEKTDEFCYKLIHTPSQTVYSKKPHKHQNGFKVFLGLTSYYTIFVDECGMTQSVAYIRCETKEISENLCKVLKHPLYKFLNNICRYGNFNNIRVLQRFPFHDDYETVYEKFGLCKKEIENITKFI
jgi:methylase of polypeptide subunit release factors